MRPPVLVAALLPVLVLSACSPVPDLPQPTGSTSAAPTATPTPLPRTDVQEIAERALDAVGDGTVVSVADESAGTSFEVHVVDAEGGDTEVHLDADGAVTAGPESEGTGPDERSRNRALVAAASLTLPQARDRMLAAVPDGTITAIELDQPQDRVAWIGDVTDPDGDRHDVRIDAVNGSVLRDRADRQGTPGGS